MKHRHGWIFILVLAININAGLFEPVTISFGGRVTDGKNDFSTKYPYQVSFQYELSENHFFHICSGSIVDRCHVVTSANCVYGGRKRVRVVAGGADLYDFPHLHTFTIDEVFIHELYNDTTMVNDIAIIRVAEGFRLDGEKLAAVNFGKELGPAVINLTASGWGYSQNPDVSSKSLQVVEFQMVPFQDCKKNYTKYNDPDIIVVDGMICADTIDKKGTCIGDSGAPVTAKGELVGIVSWGDFQCAFPMYPGVFTDIAYYKDWILSRIAASYSYMEYEKMEVRDNK